MRVELSIDGGFAYIPGVAEAIVVDASQLSAVDAAECARLCGAALALTQRTRSVRTSPMPDARRYRVTIETGGAQRTLAATDPVDEPALEALIAFVRNHGRR
jgi:hypothetical protein